MPATQMTFDAANRLATFNGQTVTHDADGNMVSGPLPSTGAMGNYTYDSRNRLTGAGGFAYRYNAEGNRVGLTSPNETTTLTVDPQGALPKVLERVKNGVRTRYVYGAGLQYEVNDAGAATYYHYDQTGNTAALTNQAGAIIERVVYSPYGTIRYRQSNYDTPFLYGGFFAVMTDANGLINMRARYYNPLTMRFLNSDPAMDGLNWYAYANGNPINFADPTGYGAQKVLGAMNSGLNALGMVTNSFLNLVPGQAAWQNSVASAQSGNYGQAAAHFGIMAAEMVVTAYTAGAGGSAIAASRAAPMTVTAARGGGALPADIASTFRGGNYGTRVLQSDVEAFRFSGGIAAPQGRFLTTSQTVTGIATPGEAISALNLPSGATATQLNSLIIPKGTNIFYGRVEGGSATATQIFIQNPGVLRPVP